ncbi:MAG: hypothetical protein J4F44_07590 [Acidimicrobiia bacterium]|nr:hypothetical protein [Acidimicrobiia bacterium]
MQLPVTAGIHLDHLHCGTGQGLEPFQRRVARTAGAVGEDGDEPGLPVRAGPQMIECGAIERRWDVR